MWGGVQLTFCRIYMIFCITSHHCCFMTVMRYCYYHLMGLCLPKTNCLPVCCNCVRRSSSGSPRKFSQRLKVKTPLILWLSRASCSMQLETQSLWHPHDKSESRTAVGSRDRRQLLSQTNANISIDILQCLSPLFRSQRSHPTLLRDTSGSKGKAK
jgi:hypothetical protein